MHSSIALMASFAALISAAPTPTPVTSGTGSCTTHIPILFTNAIPLTISNINTTATTIFNASSTIVDGAVTSGSVTSLNFYDVPINSFQYTLHVTFPTDAQITTSGSTRLEIDTSDVNDNNVGGSGFILGEFTPSAGFSQELGTVTPPRSADVLPLGFQLGIASSESSSGTVSFVQSQGEVGQDFTGFYLTVGDCP
ncbi:hypothetical protein F5884DRAFT_833438 [Xylogone sp. PMI_703]|nr:hypothetical protein F5884DRAFT_833438 [Xylogone sp. PMI_703]